MKIEKKIGIPALVAGFLMVSGCASLLPTEPKYYPKPTFDQSHAILIDRTVDGLQIVAAVKDYVKKTEKLAVESIERNTTGDKSINYLIDDNFISNLTEAGYRVLERDDNMMGRIIPEQSGTYKESLLNEYLTPPSVAMLYALEKTKPSREDGAQEKTTDLSGLYKQIKEDFAALEAQQVRLDSADVIITYRLLECGIILDIEKKKQGKINASTGAEDPSSPKVWTYNIRRDALARVFLRVMDAKTGEIRMAKTLQNGTTDTVTFRQEDGEKDADFFARIDGYIALFAKYHYAYYDQQLPNQRGTGDQLITVTDKSPTTGGSAPSSAPAIQTSVTPTTAPAATVKTVPQQAAAAKSVVYATVTAGMEFPVATGPTSPDIAFTSLLGLGCSLGLFEGIGVLACVDGSMIGDDLFLSGGISYTLDKDFIMGVRAGASVISSSMVASVPLILTLDSLGFVFDIGLTMDMESDGPPGFFVGIGAGFSF